MDQTLPRVGTPSEQGQFRQSPFSPRIWLILRIRTLVSGTSFEREREMEKEEDGWRLLSREGSRVEHRLLWPVCSTSPEQYCFIIYSVAGLGVEGHRFPGKV